MEVAGVNRPQQIAVSINQLIFSENKLNENENPQKHLLSKLGELQV